MQHDTLSGKRLYAFIGEQVCDLPASFLQKLEILLQEQRREDARQSPVHLRLVRRHEHDGNTTAPHDAGCLHCRQTSIVFRHTLQSLSAILEILQAAHLDEPDTDGEKMLAPHLVEGLLAAGRGLADTTLKTLDDTR